MKRYVGSLHETGNLSSNYNSFAFESADGKDAAIAQLRASAEQDMEDSAIASATLTMTEDGTGIGALDLENHKYALRP